MNYHSTVTTPKLVAFLALTLLLATSGAGLLAQESSSQPERDSTRPFAVLTVHEDGTTTLEPYDPEADAQASGSDVPARSVDPVADEGSPTGEVGLQSIDRWREPAESGEMRLQSLDPAVDEMAAPSFEVQVWSVDSQSDPWWPGDDARIRSVDPLAEPPSQAPDEVAARSVDPMLEPDGGASRLDLPEREDGVPVDDFTGVPDLVMLAISGFCNSSGTLGVSGTVANIGGSNAGAFRVGVYASTNSTITTSDTLIAFANYSGLSAGFSSNFSGDVSVSISPGTYYIGAYADDLFQVGESDGTNNTLAGNQEFLPCSGPTSPDLRISSISGFCTSGGTLALSGTVQNIGTGSAGAFEVGVYASTNSTISTGDTRIAFADYSGGLSAGSSNSFSGDVTVSISPGTYYIGAYADDQFEVSESSESNNTLAGNQEGLPCSGPSVDLSISSISGSCNPDGTLAVVGTVVNTGSGSAGAFRVGTYASTNSTISTGDDLIGIANYSGLGAGSSSSFSGDLDVSGVSPGTYYIGAYADDQFQVSETSESNNSLAGNQASLPCPTTPNVDLIISAIGGSCNTDGTLAVAGTVQNVDSDPSGAFRVGVYASTNSTISTGDTLIAFASYSSLGGGSSSSFSGDIDVSSVSPGTYFIGAYADDQFVIAETNEGNNTLAGNQQFLPCPTPTVVDLTISAISGTCNTDGTLAVAGTVQNLGPDASGAFRVGVYASTNSTISTGDTLIAFASYTGGLGGGSSSSFSGDVDVSSVSPGTYFIGAYADDQFQVSESSEGNNTLAGNQQFLPCPTPTVVDLTISAISGTCNTDGTLAIAGTVQNLGPDASGAFRVGVYASTGSVISTADTLIAFASYAGGLGGGSSSSFSGDIDVSGVSPPGTYYIGAYADDQFQVSETNEGNNTLAGNQAPLPCPTPTVVDLTISAISGTCNSDDTLALAGTVQNVGPDASGSFRVGVYASTNSTISTGDTLIAFASYTGGLGGGSSSSFSGDIDVSSVSSGTYFIGAYADDQFAVAETNESNNTLAGNQADLPCSGSTPPDIRIEPLTLTFSASRAPAVKSSATGAAARVMVGMSSPELASIARGLPVGGALRIEEVPLEWGSPDTGLELERFEAFAPDATIVVHGDDGDHLLPVPGNVYFRGGVEGDPQSRVFLTVRAHGGARGLIASGGRYWVLGDQDAGGPAVGLGIREIDAETELAAYASAFDCALDELAMPFDLPAPPAASATIPRPSATGRASTYAARIAVETDWEFYQLFGSATAAADYVADLIGFSSGIYAAEIDTDLVLGHVSLWSTSADPWNEFSTVCGLYEFGRYWNDNHGGIDRSLAHFLSGKSNGGGVAWLGVLCDGEFNVNHGGSCSSLTPQTDNYGGAYGYSGTIDGDFDINNPTVVWDIMVASHEIGHNFDSPHTHCYGGIGGNANPVDECTASQCGGSGCFCGSPSLPCATAGAGCGTIMSYCHLLTGGLGNISMTFGTGHPFGVAPDRVPTLMSDYVVNTAAADPSCLAGGGGGTSQTFTIFNDGGSDLTVTSIALEDPAPWISWTPPAPFIVPPGGSRVVTVSVDFGIAPPGSSTDRILVESDDLDESPYPGGVFVNVNNDTGSTCYPLSRTHTGSGADPVPSPANSPGCPSFEYVAGAVIQLAADPAPGWIVESWTGTDNDSSTATTNSVTMPASSHSVGVNYTEITPTCYPLSRTHTGNGTDPVPSPANSPGCPTFEYAAGTVIQLTASPAPGWIVESWTGTDNDSSTATTNSVTMPASSHSVGVNYIEGTSPCSATRSLPAGYVPGQPSPVTIDVAPPATTLVYAVEDDPPAGWTVSDIDNGGVFDPITGTVKWGPFFDNQSRTLSYDATPPAGTTGNQTFSGTLSVDGSNESICGDDQLDPATFHPADMSDNWRMEIDEVTAYGASWKTGATWPRPPNPIPIDYVTNAGFLWKLGEVYHFDPAQDPPWVPGAAFPPARGSSLLSGAVSSFDPAEYTPGTGVEVTIAVAPDASVEVYAAEDGPPAGWTVSGISHSGSFDSVNNLVKWGPFFDNSVRSLVYTATPPAGAAGPQTFAGQASFDGSSMAVTGDRTIYREGEHIFSDDFESGDASAW